MSGRADPEVEHVLVHRAPGHLEFFTEEVEEVPGAPGMLKFERKLIKKPGKENVVACRVDSADLQAIDILVEAGIRPTRSEAAAWLIHAGIEAQQALLAELRSTVAEIRRLREQAQATAQRHAGAPAPAPPSEAQPGT